MQTESINITVPKKFGTLMLPNRYHVFYGGRGSGKSHSIARYLICAAMANRLKILCTREIQNSIGDSVHRLLSDVINNNKLNQWFDVKQAEIVCKNGSSFIFKGLFHNIESVKSTEGVDICWIEEADKIRQSSWDILIPTIRKPGSKIVISFNPTKEDDPVYTMFVKNEPPKNSIVTKVNWSDNPHFPDVLKYEMEHAKLTDYDKYLHVWEGFTQTHSDAQVFKGKFFVEDFEASPDEHFRFGADWGFAKDPSTLVRCFARGENLYIDYEAYGHGVELTELPEFFRSVPESTKWKILGDCARPETISFLKNLNWNIEAAPKWAGSVEDGIEFIRSFKKIIIHPRCKNTLVEFSSYSYKVDRRTSEILPIVVDEQNHIIDAIRYALSNLIKRKTTIYDSGFF